MLAKQYMEARRVSWNTDSESSKTKRLIELVEEAKANNYKVIVFSYFKETIRKICSLTELHCTKPIGGSVPGEERQRIIDSFESA